MSAFQKTLVSDQLLIAVYLMFYEIQFFRTIPETASIPPVPLLVKEKGISCLLVKEKGISCLLAKGKGISCLLAKEKVISCLLAKGKVFHVY